MKMSSGLFLHFIFIALLSSVFSYNPDSIVAESPADNKELTGKIQIQTIKEKTIMRIDLPRFPSRIPDSIMIQSLLNITDKIGKIEAKGNEQKAFTKLDQPCDPTKKPDDISILNPVDSARRMGKLQMGDGQQKLFVSLDRDRSVVFRYMVPEYLGAENLWREVSRKTVDTTEDFTKRAGRIQMEEDKQKEVTSSDQFPVQTDYPDSVKFPVQTDHPDSVKFPVQTDHPDSVKFPVQTDHPDSVMIQSPADNIETMGNMQMGDCEHTVFLSSDGSNSFVVTCMELIVLGSERVWREVYRKRIDTTRGFIPVPVTRTYPRDRPLRPNPYPNWTTERSITDVNVRTTPAHNRRPQTPRNSVKGNDDDNRENSMTTNPSLTTESEEGIFEDGKTKTAVTKPPGKISPNSNLFAGIVNDFAFKLVETLDLKSNFVISPLSIFIALSMCYLGTDGTTKAQMEEILGMNAKAIRGEQLHQGIKDLLSSVTAETSGYKLLVANGMFFAKNFEANSEFEENIRKFYDAELKGLDFGNPPISLQSINKWVSESTRNTIMNIINSPPSVETRLMLLNAVYFKGSWKMQFPLQYTHDAKFQTLDGKYKKIEMMRMHDPTFPVLERNNHTFIKLPYEGDQLSMIIALPFAERAEPLPYVRNEILSHVRAAMKDINLRRVDIPKFHLEYTKSLKRPLEELGIQDIFGRNSVNLSKLRKENDIIVADIMHKAVVEVNEVGTTASGITADNFTPLISRQSTNFVANHPFAFYIVHEPTGLVLFYGKAFDFDTEEIIDTVDQRPNVNSRPRINSERRRVYG